MQNNRDQSNEDLSGNRQKNKFLNINKDIPKSEWWIVLRYIFTGKLSGIMKEKQ